MNKEKSEQRINKAVTTLIKKGCGIFFKPRKGIKVDWVNVRTDSKGKVTTKIATDIIDVTQRTIVINNLKSCTLGNGSWGAIDTLINHAGFTLIGQSVYATKSKHGL